MTQQRAIPAAVSPIAAGQPRLRPSGGTGLRVGGQSEEPQADGLESGSGGVVASGRHDATQKAPAAPARRARAGRRPAPKAADAVALTVRFDPTESVEVDFLVLELKEETGRRLDKAEIVRELLRLTREHPGTRAALVKRLKA